MKETNSQHPRFADNDYYCQKEGASFEIQEAERNDDECPWCGEDIYDDSVTCDYCGSDELAYELESDRGTVRRCLPCLAVERAQQKLSLDFETFVEADYAQSSYENARGWLNILGRLRQDRPILLRDEDDMRAVHEHIREFLTNIMGEDAYKKPSEVHD
jgi:hypothetical protein